MVLKQPRAFAEQHEDGRRWNGKRWVEEETLLRKLRLSPEVAAYLDARDIPWPEIPPKIKTPEPSGVTDAAFSFARVDRVLDAFSRLRHTQGPLAGQPLVPDPWQIAYFLAPVFGWIKPGGGRDGYVRIIRNATLDVPRKNGKALALDTPLWTTTGWTTMGEINAGAYVFGPDGKPTRVVGAFEVFHGHRCYDVEFSDGQVITADAEHLWTVHDRWRARTVTVDTQTMAERHQLPTTPRGRSERRYRVDVTAPLQGPRKELPIDPYLLGIWLGDGATQAARITSADPEVVDAFREHYTVRPIKGTTIEWGVSGGLKAALRNLGVLGDKRIPAEYMAASQEQRLALLQGLMDSDGFAGAGKGLTPRCEYCTMLPALADQVLELVRGLGYKATLKRGQASVNGRVTGEKHRVFFNAYRETTPFRLERKTRRLRPAPDAAGHRARSRSLTVVDVREVPSVPTRCIKVEREDGLYLAGKGFVTTHNTTLCGGVAIYLTAADGEAGAQVIAAATTKDQAGFTFAPIKTLAEKAPALRGHVKPFKERITHPRSGSYFQVISSAADAQHGANLHGGIVDELHVHKKGDLVEAIETGTGSREQPLICKITTADDGKPQSPYSQNREYLEKLARGVFKDPTVYGVIFAAGDNDDPFSPETWRKANPGYGVSPKADYLASEANKAKNSPVLLARFKRLHLGIRTRQTTAFIQTKDWRMNSGGPIRESDLAGRPAYGGLDLASVSDLTALCWLFPYSPDRGPGYDALWRFWTPEDNLDALDDRTAGRASRDWVKNGWLTVTPGNVTDYGWVKAQIKKDADTFDVQSVGFDRWNSSQLVTDLMDDGVNMVRVGQGYMSMSPALKEVHRLVRMGASGRPADRVPRLRNGGNPVALWCVDNLAVDMDPSGNVKPSKANSADKIDGVSALCDAIYEAISSGGVRASTYESDDLRVV